MEALRQAVKACKSGPALLAALEGAGAVSNGPIPDLIADCVTETAAGPKPANGSAERASIESALCVIDGLMFLSPRGKQQLALFKHCLMVKTAKADIAVPWSAIRHVAIIDQVPGDTKGRVLLYLHLDSGAKVLNGKTPLSAVVIQTTADAQLDVANPADCSQRLQGPAPVVLCQALGAVPGGPGPASFVSPDPEYFESAGKAAGLKAHIKARDGFLYPLPSALCFLEAPQMFLPHSSVASVELMRAGGSSTTFDLVAHLKDGSAVEFGMIGRQELPAIEEYIRKCRLALGAAGTSEEEGEGQGAESGAEPSGQEEDSDDEEDEDFNPSSSSDEEEGGQGEGQADKKRKRSAAGAADGAAAGGGSGGEGEEEEESSEEDSSEEEEDTSDDGSDGDVELVSEDEFSRQQLVNMIAGEGAGGRRAKRQRGGDGGASGSGS